MYLTAQIKHDHVQLTNGSKIPLYDLIGYTITNVVTPPEEGPMFSLRNPYIKSYKGGIFPEYTETTSVTIPHHVLEECKDLLITLIRIVGSKQEERDLVKVLDTLSIRGRAISPIELIAEVRGLAKKTEGTDRSSVYSTAVYILQPYWLEELFLSKEVEKPLQQRARFLQQREKEVIKRLIDLMLDTVDSKKEGDILRKIRTDVVDNLFGNALEEVNSLLEISEGSIYRSIYLSIRGMIAVV